jgi:hypothetical protein
MGVSNSTRFIRRTSFQSDEQHINFTKLDNEILDVITSPEACEICPSISRVYLRLLRTPFKYWEREGIIYFNGEVGERGYCTAWQQLIHITGVGNSTLSKALRFLHEAGVIGYSPKAAGAGIRIFFNHALASIKKRPQKNLRLLATPIEGTGNPKMRVAFSGMFLQEVQDNNSRTSVRTQQINPPRLTHDPIPTVEKSQPKTTTTRKLLTNPVTEQTFSTPQLPVLPKLRTEDPIQIMQDWLNSKAIPKATRIAVKESLDWLKSQGFISKQNDHLQQTRPSSNLSRWPTIEKSCTVSLNNQAKDMLQTLSSQQKQRWTNQLREEITKLQLHSHQLQHWDDKTWLETIEATMLQRLKTALYTIKYWSQTPNSQSSSNEELNELSQAYGLLSNLFGRDMIEMVRDDLDSGSLTSSRAQELIEYCRPKQSGLTFVSDQ